VCTCKNCNQKFMYTRSNRWRYGYPFSIGSVGSTSGEHTGQNFGSTTLNDRANTNSMKLGPGSAVWNALSGHNTAASSSFRYLPSSEDYIRQYT
jgi:hypothetical protein